MEPAPSPARFARWPLIAFPLAKLAIQLFAYRGYGIFRDELYYIACAKRLAWGYVDQPPFSIAALAVQRALLGESLFALRLIPALVGAATVAVVGLIARRLGGGVFAQALAMVTAGVATYNLAIHHVYSMNAWEGLFWALAAWILTGILTREGESDREWLLLGGVLGLGLLNKVSVLWLGVGLAAGLLLTRERRRLATRGPWIAGIVAMLLFAPFLAWQAANGWPIAEFIANATGRKMLRLTPWAFLRTQLEILGPLAPLVWLPGLVWFFRRPRLRVLGWTWVVVTAILVVNGASRPGYLAPAYAWLLAAGGVAWERWSERSGRFRPVPRARWALPAAIVAAGAAVAPLALPLLPVESYIRYAERLGEQPSTMERKELAELPQFYADMHGWQSIADTVSAVWAALPPEEREVALVLASNYGEAGAVELLADDPELRAAVASGHNNYWFWGPPQRPIEVVIVLNAGEGTMREWFEEVELAARTDCGYCMPYENRVPVWVGRKPRGTISEAWPMLRHFD